MNCRIERICSPSCLDRCRADIASSGFQAKLHWLPMGRKLCIFGGGGFLGSAIIDKLLSEGWNLRVFERPGVLPHRSFGADEAVEWVEGDFANAKDISPAVHGMDAVLHLISTTRPKDSNDDPVGDVQSNLLSSIQLLEALRAEGPKKRDQLSSLSDIGVHCGT